MKMHIKQPDIQIQVDLIGQAIRDNPRRVSEAVLAGTLDVHGTAVRPGYAPYKTGTLRRSITFTQPAISGNKVEASVGSNLAYARIHEYGGLTGRGHSVIIKPSLYMTRATDENREKIKARFAKIAAIKNL